MMIEPIVINVLGTGFNKENLQDLSVPTTKKKYWTYDCINWNI